MCNGMLNDRSRMNIFKLRGVQITQLEAKVLQYVIMKNKQIHTLDLSLCKGQSGEDLETFMQKVDQFAHIRNLTMEQIFPDLSTSIEVLGEALSYNTKLESLILRDNKIKWVPYSNFWDNIKSNVTIKKINVSKTEL